MNLIGEWSGCNFNVGFSVWFFQEFGFVLMVMWENILLNCDYGCIIDVLDYLGGFDLLFFEDVMIECV